MQLQQLKYALLVPSLFRLQLPYTEPGHQSKLRQLELALQKLAHDATSGA